MTKKSIAITPEYSQSTRSLLLGISSHLSRRRRIQLGFLLLVMLMSGGAELLSLGAVFPFLAVLSHPERLWQQPFVRMVAELADLSSPDELLLPATLLFVIAVVVAAIVRLANLWLNGQIAAAIGSDLSCEAYKRTLHQPYLVHVQRNSSSVITGAISHIGRTVAAFTALLQLITSVIVAIGLLAGLFVIDWSVALGALLLFSTLYSLLAISVRSELRSNSQRISTSVKQQIKALQEGLGAIRDVLLDGNQAAYVEIYRQADRPQRQLQAKNQVVGAFPRDAVEGIGLVAIALLAFLLAFQKGTSFDVIPLLGGLALGAQRLLPALQQIYGSWSLLKNYNADLEAVLAMLNQPLPSQIKVASKPTLLVKSVRLESVYFRYGPDQPDVLRDLNLEIHRGERIGLVGSTGSGKSTTVDLLMGLLPPSSGRLLVDGIDLHDARYPERLEGWRSAIAHVPQNIFLADSSIAENIAFGVPRHQIDLERVKDAAAQAQIAGFIESSSEAYESFVGERGIRLSGGQRQRIGIARALYKRAWCLC